MDLLVVADTGAAKSIFPLSSLPTGVQTNNLSTKLRAANRMPLENLGTVDIRALFGEGPEAKIEAIVSSDLHGPPLISFRDLLKMGAELRFPVQTHIIKPIETEIYTINVLSLIHI